MLHFLSALLPKSLQKVSAELAPETMTVLGEDLSKVNTTLETANALQAQVDSLETQLAAEKDNVKALKSQVDAITAHKDSLTADLQAATQKATQLQGLIDDFKNKAEDGGSTDATNKDSSKLTYSQKLLSKEYGITI